MATVKSLKADVLSISPSSNRSNTKLPCYSCDLFHCHFYPLTGLFIMVIELSGVQFGLKSFAWFPNQTSAQCEFDLKSQVWFQTKIARHEVQLPLYYIHFEITQIQDVVSSNILLMQYWAGLKLNSSIFGREKVRVLEIKVAKFAT